MKKDNPEVMTHSDTAELPDGTKLKVTVTKYEKPLYPLGEPMYVERKIDYAGGKTRGTRFVDCVSDLENEEALKKEVEVIINQINTNPDLFKFQHAPK